MACCCLLRTWDLRHSPRLQAQFPGPPAQLVDLDDDELSQLRAWPALAELVETAPADFRLLLRNPFNLRLAAELLLAGTAISELQTVRDRLELLDRYWQRRVTEGLGGTGRHALLGRLSDYAVRKRTLTAPVADVLGGDATGEVLDSLLSRSVLVDATALPSPGAVGAVRFAHHVLFDYAVALTVFAPTDQATLQRLHDDPDLVLFARPSIDMHFERLWSIGAARFWAAGMAIASDDTLPRFATVAVAEVAARRAVAIAELAPLIDPVVTNQASLAQHRLLRYLVLAVVIDREDSEAPDPGVWPAVVERLSENVGGAELPLRILLDELVGREVR